MNGKKLVFRYYSLVEMLTVMAIIAILVGLGAGGYSVGRRWLAQTRTEALLAKIRLALESYKNDKGYYPQPLTGSAVEFRLDANVGDFTGSVPSSNDHLQPRNNMSRFMDYGKLRQSDQSFKVEHSNYIEYFPRDAWNTGVGSLEYGPIMYQCPGTLNPTSFDLYAAGHDRNFASNPADDTEDDIYAK